jgi:hypothetical protein
MPTTNELAYIAGLFDGEGSIQCKQVWEASRRKTKPRKYKIWRITMEISMVDETLIRWVHEKLDVGTVSLNVKNKYGMNWIIMTLITFLGLLTLLSVYITIL